MFYAFNHFSKGNKEIPLNLKDIFRNRTNSHKEKFNNLLAEVALDNRNSLTKSEIDQIINKMFQHIFQVTS